MKSLIMENERLDDLQNGYMLIQNPKQFCFGIDAVLLAWFARVKPGENALDMGTGTGIVPILLKARYRRGILRDWRSRRRARRWPDGAWLTTDWMQIFPLKRVTSGRRRRLSEHPLLTWSLPTRLI